MKAEKEYLVGDELNKYLIEEYESDDFLRLKIVTDFVNICKKNGIPAVVMAETKPDDPFVIYSSVYTVIQDESRETKVRLLKTLLHTLRSTYNYFKG